LQINSSDETDGVRLVPIGQFLTLETAGLPFRKDWQGITGIFSSKSED